MSIILKIDKPVYQQADIIQVRGSVAPILENIHSIHYSVVVNDTEAVETGDVFINQLGHYNFRISARGEGWVNGSYHLTVQYGLQTVFETFQYRNVIVPEDIDVWRTKVETLEEENLFLSMRNDVLKAKLDSSRALRAELQAEIDLLREKLKDDI